ncbi:uncharacterized protein LOC130724504 isoform X7 [Lotus japonicus]|uniref:uncharacterized protein LOC130724504 isoform X7 n=1 Tax=Lotus japonicus TaxID=34305 RepID=UPI0025896285|nr:uncharacterized protein LOC130724504 isoform X7 [Lotus japonicus]
MSQKQHVWQGESKYLPLDSPTAPFLHKKIFHQILPLLFPFFQCTIFKIWVLSPNRSVSRKRSEKEENGEGQDRSLQLWSEKGKGISQVVQLLLKRTKRGEEKEEEEDEKMILRSRTTIVS